MQKMEEEEEVFFCSRLWPCKRWRYRNRRSRCVDYICIPKEFVMLSLLCFIHFHINLWNVRHILKHIYEEQNIGMVFEINYTCLSVMYTSSILLLIWIYDWSVSFLLLILCCNLLFLFFYFFGIPISIIMSGGVYVPCIYSHARWELQ